MLHYVNTPIDAKMTIFRRKIDMFFTFVENILIMGTCLNYFNIEVVQTSTNNL